MMKANSIELKVLGQKIALKTTESNPELIQEVVDLVTSKIKLAESRVKGAAAHQVTLLAILDLAEEYIGAKRRTADFKKSVTEKSSYLLDLIEAELK
jgi:cell division protein ZapA (FtsZ GTPase activity inhibitor)